MKAWLPKASEENEHADTMITTPEGVDVLCRQIAGAVARRIVTYAKEEKSATSMSISDSSNWVHEWMCICLSARKYA